MMLAWTFPARTADEVGALLRALGRHRYVQEVDHRLHWAVDRALAHHDRFAPHAARLSALAAEDRNLDLSSRDPRLWRKADADDIALALSLFWEPNGRLAEAHERLLSVLAEAGLDLPVHAPFRSDPEDPPFPELLELNWVLFPVEALDAERHEGALRAMEAAAEEVDVSAPVYQEGPCIAAPELVRGTRNGVLFEPWVMWSDGPFSYSDYIFRGAAKAARLVDPPEPARDELEEEGDEESAPPPAPRETPARVRGR